MIAGRHANIIYDFPVIIQESTKNIKRTKIIQLYFLEVVKIS